MGASSPHIHPHCFSAPGIHHPLFPRSSYHFFTHPSFHLYSFSLSSHGGATSQRFCFRIRKFSHVSIFNFCEISHVSTFNFSEVSHVSFLIFARFITWVFAREFCHVKSHVTRARDKIHVKYDVIKVTWQTCIFFRQFARPLSPRKRPYFRPLFLLSPTFATFFFSTYWYGNHRSRVIWGGEHPWWC